MRVPLRRMGSWIALSVCLVAAVVIDPTAVPPGRLWHQELAKLRKQLEAIPSDFEKTSFLRQYVGALIDIGRPDERTRRLYESTNFETFDPAQFYGRFRAHSMPAECGITTFFYMKLLHAFGFKAYQYSFGFTEQAYARIIHSVVLVEILDHKSRRLIVQDPYLNLTFRDTAGEPIDFFDFLLALKSREFDRIVMDAPAVSTWLQVSDPSVYYAFLNEPCRNRMADALRREDGSLRTRIPVLRSYANLMQSECGNFEAAFVDAMSAHGLREPFLYSYTLQASDIVGSHDHGELQERVDALLHEHEKD